MTNDEAIKYIKSWNPIHPLKQEAKTKAITALIEQQPQVLWIGQLTPGVFVYVEYMDIVRGQFLIARNGNTGVISWAWGNGYKGYDMMKDYGKLWRAWDKMPTDEQRKAAAWG